MGQCVGIELDYCTQRKGDGHFESEMTRDESSIESMNRFGRDCKVAVVGAGIAGSALARALMDEGAAVHVFDKACVPGGRMATRRCVWTDAGGNPRVTAFDHGAPFFSAKDAAFRAAVAQAVHAGCVTTWQPRLHPMSLPCPEAEQCSAHFVAAPAMPQWCSHLLQGAMPRWEQAVQRLRRTPQGWTVESGDLLWADVFDAVVLALPPAQAAPLLASHHREWAQRASLTVMQPCWTVMGICDPIPGLRAWDLARPEAGALATVLRNETRPGREARSDEVHWVMHAKAGWSRAHMDQDSAWIASAMQQALSEWLGTPLRWQHAVAHRWRYAMPQTAGRHPVTPGSWWDDSLRLGVCGDFLGGGGVEGAWSSARSLAQAMLGVAEPAAAEEPALVSEEDGL
jgi:renalase